MFKQLTQNKWLSFVWTVLGTIICAAACNLFVVPLGLYSGGFLGLAQIIRTILTDNLGINLGTHDIAGIIYYIMNIPLIIISFVNFGKTFVAKMFIATTVLSLSMVIIPIPSVPIVEERVTGCIIAGFLDGIGLGMVLTAGGCQGGTDVIGLLLSKRGYSSVGRFSIFFNSILYFACAVMFSISTSIYSIIRVVSSSVVTDKLHLQNNNCQFTIITKDDISDIEEYVMKYLVRGITSWKATGEYTGDDIHVYTIFMNQFEVNGLKEKLHESHPGAFVVVQNVNQLTGNFERHLYQ